MNRLKYLQEKIVDVNEANFRIEGWRLKKDKIVFTNGCFDILHRGHVTYLAQSASCGNKLVIGLNSDDSVRRQGKGDDRPVNDEISRAIVLAALGFVDLIVFFNEDTPIELIKQLKPDVLVKGADYNPEETNPQMPGYIVGSDIVKKYGGEVKAIPLVEGFSTTSIIGRVKGDL